MTPDRRLSCLSIFLFIALCASLFVNFVLMIAAFKRVSGIREAEPIPRFREILLQRGARATTEKIAVITMRGLISSSIPGNVSDSMVDDLRAALQQARDDSRVKAIVLEIDSPGGEVTASDEIYNAVVKTRATKPVVVYMESLAASGGYYVSCGGRFLMANETTITGSIGVIIQTLNYEQLFNKIGLASVVFKSGKFKDMLNGARPITPEERELVQSFIMGTYDKFLGIVAKERNLPADLLRNSIADGRILSGKEALQNKLIDGLGELDDAFTKAKQLANAPDAKVVKYRSTVQPRAISSSVWRIRFENRIATSEATAATARIGTRVFPAQLLRSVAVRVAHATAPSMMLSGNFFAALGAAPNLALNLLSVLYLVGSVCVYLSLISQIVTGIRTRPSLTHRNEPLDSRKQFLRLC